jgi:hypothetical protein
MFEMKCRKYNEAELEEITQLFAESLAADTAFAAAFPNKKSQSEHARSFVNEYARTGEIHTVYENGAFTAAALWSLPYQHVPSPVYDFDCSEPCCKLYLIASREKGMGDALMHFALFRYSVPLLLVCAADWQAGYFSRYGFKPSGKTGFGTIMINDRKAVLKKDCEKC